RGGVGMELDLTKVPMRETGMTPYELMLSESQERMVLVVHRGREAEVAAVFHKWGVDVAAIGVVRKEPRMRLLWQGDVVADLEIAPLVQEAPLYRRASTAPKPLPSSTPVSLDGAPEDAAALRTLLASPNLSSKRWISTQYDWSVRTNTIAGPGGDAAIIRVPGTPKGLAMTCDVNPRYVAADPQTGAAHAVAEAALNLACVGAKPLAVTDCLNFGNPERPEILGQFAAAIRGLSEACRAFETPVVSGNVSLYNETDGVSILPTPTVGMVGLLDDVTRTVGLHFAREGDIVALLGTTRDEMGASEYVATILGRDEGPCPALDLASTRALVNLLLETVRDGMLSSAHDLSEGGLAVALAEAAMGPTGLGADVNVATPLPTTRLLFSQTAGRAVVSMPAGRERNLVEAGRRYGVAVSLLGRVVPGRLAVSVNGARVFDLATAALKAASESAFLKLLEA
ncbi:MAG TPA: AIR synthase-related protein, partial [Thermoanaerobaculia bacterium]|nr:AIR synthase-related protein [Thermoanaerobaculia bacterium]